MCLVLRSGIEDFKFAQEDMRCFKLLNMRNGQLTSPIFDKSCYEIGKAYETSLNYEVEEHEYEDHWSEIWPLEIWKKNAWYIQGSMVNIEVIPQNIGQGFHSYKHLRDALRALKFYLYEDYVLAACTIPKHSGYYSGHQGLGWTFVDGYASDAIRIDKIIDRKTIDKLSESQSQLNDMLTEELKAFYDNMPAKANVN